MPKIRRAYGAAENGDGGRILIDRLWSLGGSKAEARSDEWTKDLALSTGLRQSFGHDPDKWEEFRKRCKRELASPERTRWLEEIARRARSGPVTLLYGARDEDHNNAKVLEEIISEFKTRPAARTPGG